MELYFYEKTFTGLRPRMAVEETLGRKLDWTHVFSLP
jgi:hypothetical protein